MTEKLLANLKKYYEISGIAALNFHCKHLSDCRRDCEKFTEAQEALAVDSRM